MMATCSRSTTGGHFRRCQQHKDAYQAKFSKALEVPKTWEEYAQVAQFITDNLAPNVYGAGHFARPEPGQPVRLPAAVPGRRWKILQRQQ